MRSDAEYIHSAVKRYERRYKLAIIYGLLAIAWSACAYFGYVELTGSTNRLLSLIGPNLREGMTVTANTVETLKVSNTASYTLGMRVGMVLYSSAIVSGLLLGYCLYLLFGAKRERIIAELYKNSKI